MDPIDELEKFTFEMIAKQDRLMSQAREEGKSLQHIAEIYSKQEGMKIIYTQILRIKSKNNSNVVNYTLDMVDPEEETERQTTFD